MKAVEEGCQDLSRQV